jgi:hypothetical protein
VAFAVAAQVAAPLLEAWQVAPQPVSVSGCESPGETQIEAPPSSPAPAPPPSTGALTSFNGRYFTVSYPSDWTIETAETQKAGYLDTTIRNPADSNVYLRVDVTPGVRASDPIEAAAPVVRLLSKQPGYQLLAYERTTFAAYDALHWEYLVPEHGVLLHKIDVFFIDQYGNGFGVLTQSPASEWEAWAESFDSLRASLVVPTGTTSCDSSNDAVYALAPVVANANTALEQMLATGAESGLYDAATTVGRTADQLNPCNPGMRELVDLAGQWGDQLAQAVVAARSGDLAKALQLAGEADQTGRKIAALISAATGGAS